MKQWELIVLTLVGLFLSGCGRGQSRIPEGGPAAGWEHYGGDAGGSRHSTLTQIDRGNVGQLQLAWSYRTGEDFSVRGAGQKAFEATPILVDGRLYLSTPSSRIVALDPETGRELWVFDPKVDTTMSYSEYTSRGVSAWRDPQAAPGALCALAVYTGTIDARLIAVDGITGHPCPRFGNNGTVDLSAGVGTVERGDYQVTSPPAILNGIVVIGSAIGDNRGVELERGVVRAYEARSGALRWAWDPIPRDPADPARATWEGESADRTGAANAWSILSADAERDLVFVPTSSPSPDHYGGERLGDNRYANSVVALRGSTGEIVWHFQIVHHDLWDYDVPAQPTLITVQRDGRDIPAVAQATKMGMIFLFHRETGEPLFPIEERPVPQTDVPGERTSPTQPFPVLPRPLVPHELRPEDAWGLTPGRRSCRSQIESMRNEGIYTPPSLKGSLVYPGLAGGSNWGSVAYEPSRGLLIANTSRLPFYVRLVPRSQFDEERKNGKGEFARQAGTPYGMQRYRLVSPLGLPCSPPPWGTLAAIDMNTGDVRWEVPLGTTRDLAPVPIAVNTGTPSMGGPIVTASGLIFIAAAMDNYLRAFDIDTGGELWKARLPAGAQATPMTYRLQPAGRQHVVIAAGGHGKAGTKLGDHVLAFALDVAPQSSQ